jgi:peptidoglycan hydrolase-like protein with peptidoglycan-binding domain
MGSARWPAIAATLLASALLGAPARGDDTLRVADPPAGTTSWPGATLPVQVAPDGARLRIKGPARLVDGKLLFLRDGTVELTAVLDEKKSDPVVVHVVSLANEPLGEANAPPRLDLDRGDKGMDVATLQKLLAQALQGGGAGFLSPDGQFGPRTAQALQQFQAAHGLAPTGFTNPQTWGALGGGAFAGAIAPRTHDGPAVGISGPGTGRAYHTGWGGALTQVHDAGPVEVAPGVTRDALSYTGGMNIDADGAGAAWRGDRYGQPNTSLRDAQGRSLDPTVTPYVVLPGGFERDHPGVHLGDIVAVQYQGKTVYAIYGDVGPRNKIGEASIATARALGISASPNNGGTSSGVTYTVFPGSGTGRPLTNDEIDRRGAALLAQVGHGTGSGPTGGIAGGVERALGGR